MTHAARRGSGTGVALLVLAELLALPCLPCGVLRAQDGTLAEEAYATPPPEIAEFVLAPRHRNVSVSNPSPDRTRFAWLVRDGLPRLADYARLHYNLGGLQIDPAANRARSLTTGNAVGLEIISFEDGTRVRVQVPEGAKVSSPRWSPDGSRIAFFVHLPDATHIYVADPATGRARRVTRTPVLATLVTNFDWTGDGRRILTVLVPDRGKEPRPPAVATGPKVRLTAEGENRLRTFVDLLETPYEKDLLEYHITGQLALIDVDSRAVRRIGEPAMYSEIDVAPDGQYVRVTTIQEPFPYIVPVSRFATVEEIRDLDGRVLAELARQPVRDGTPGARDSTQGNGRRALAWRPDGQGLSFLQLEPAPSREAAPPDSAAADSAADGGRQPARRKDRVMQWLPPFDSTSVKVVYESDSRMSNVRYSADGSVLFITESSDGATHEYAVFLSDPSRKYTISRTRGSGAGERRGSDPGRASLVMRPGPVGEPVVQLSSDGRFVFLEGTTYAEDPMEQAPRPYLDRLELKTGEKARIFESEPAVYENLVLVLDDDATRLATTRESPTQVPDVYVREVATGRLRKITGNRDYTPDLTAAPRRRIRVTRVDGFRFWVEVTLPPGYVEGTRLPALFWFYPREFTDQAAYDRRNRTYNKNRFPALGPRSMEALVRLGYAVVEPDAPIVGPQGRMNDSYVPDLRNTLAAVIDELDRLGIIDRTRLAIGGHSYGAFGTVNAMVHTPFFKAGIAGDGNYNRLLTPLGFQTERRDLWSAREVYLTMSPFLWAEQLNGALLMYHGIEDQNVGTHLINSQRLFHALDGLGKTAALYMYPYEDHGPATRETLLDLWARWVAWLDTHVKNAGQEERKAADVAASESADR
ncbi:MAG TPA: prolyl oligopeptidase family serine peptidase [Longimicrobiales bacterium]